MQMSAKVLPLQEIGFAFQGPLPAEDLDESQVPIDSAKKELSGDPLSKGEWVRALAVPCSSKLVLMPSSLLCSDFFH